MRSRKTPERLILMAGLLAYVLFFVRVAVFYAPDRYIGPSGADRVYYYAYVRSIVIDCDLDFSNEYRLRPPSSGMRIVGGRALNKFPIGAPLLSLPFYAATHFALVATSGWHDISLDGYSRVHAASYVLGQMFWVCVGLLMLYRILTMFISRAYAAWVAVLSIFSTPLLTYVGADLMMSHAASFFALTWCTYEALRLTHGSKHCVGGRSGWLRLGLACSLTFLVRYQNGVALLIPAAAVSMYIVDSARARRLGAAAVDVGAAALGGLALVLLQLVAFKMVTGSWLTNSYGSELSWGAFAWLAPPFVEAMAAIARWWPALIGGVTGSVWLAVVRRDPVVLAVATTMLLTLYVSIAWHGWSVVARAPFDNAACVAIGVAQIGRAMHRLHPAAPWALPASIALLNADYATSLFGW